MADVFTAKAEAILIEMHFLSDVWMTCDFCNGLRFNGPTLEVRWKGKNIAEILQLTVDQALTHFSAQRSIARRLQALHDVGLGYVRLDNPQQRSPVAKHKE